MFLNSSLEFDSRVKREAEALAREGYAVTVVAVERTGQAPRDENLPCGAAVRRIRPAYPGRAWIYAAKESIAARLNPVSEAGGRPRRTLREAARSFTHRALRFIWRYGCRPLLLAPGFWALNAAMIRAGSATGARVFHAHDLDTLYVGAVCKRRAGGTLFYDSHELATERTVPIAGFRTAAKVLERWLIGRADAVILVSPSIVKHYAKLYPNVSDFALVRNCAERSNLRRPRDLRRLLGIRADERIVLYQGLLEKNRGIEPAVEALSRLANCVLVLLGYGSSADLDEFRRLVEAKQLADKVRFLEAVPPAELLEFTAGADVGLCTIIGASLSFRYALPNKLFEYLAAGLPVVVSDLPDLSAVVKENALGEVCDGSDPESVAEAIERLVNDPERYRSVAANVERQAPRFSWEEEKKQLLGLYARKLEKDLRGRSSFPS